MTNCKRITTVVSECSQKRTKTTATIENKKTEKRPLSNKLQH